MFGLLCSSVRYGSNVPTHLLNPSSSMAPPRKTKLPEPLPDGFVLTDTETKRWRLGGILGHGGFGLIYLGKILTLSTHVYTPGCSWTHNWSLRDTAFVVLFVIFRRQCETYSYFSFFQLFGKMTSFVTVVQIVCPCITVTFCPAASQDVSKPVAPDANFVIKVVSIAAAGIHTGPRGAREAAVGRVYSGWRLL